MAATNPLLINTHIQKLLIPSNFTPKSRFTNTNILSVPKLTFSSTKLSPATKLKPVRAVPEDETDDSVLENEKEKDDYVPEEEDYVEEYDEEYELALAARLKARMKKKDWIPVNVGSIYTEGTKDGGQRGVQRLPLDTDLVAYEAWIFEEANKSCSEENIFLPKPYKVEKINGGVKLSYEGREKGTTVYEDWIVKPGEDGLGPLEFRIIYGKLPPFSIIKVNKPSDKKKKVLKPSKKKLAKIQKKRELGLIP